MIKKMDCTKWFWKHAARFEFHPYWQLSLIHVEESRESDVSVT